MEGIHLVKERYIIECDNITSKKKDIKVYIQSYILLENLMKKSNISMIRK